MCGSVEGGKSLVRLGRVGKAASFTEIELENGISRPMQRGKGFGSGKGVFPCLIKGRGKQLEVYPMRSGLEA